MDRTAPTVLIGGSGYLGSALAGSLLGDGAEVLVLTRGGSRTLASGAAAQHWDPAAGPDALSRHLAGATAVVNLAGESIGHGSWTPQRRELLTESRTRTTRLVVEALATLAPEQRPAALVNASGVDYYGDRGDEAVTERDAPGSSFLATLCVRWEAEASRAEAFGVRVVRIRTGLVLAHDAEVLRRLALPFQLFLGGRLGSGRQWVSWVHLADIVGLYRLALENGAVSGPMNGVAPDPRREVEVAVAVGRALHRPSWLPAPALGLRLALGGQADLVLHGRRAVPEVALAHGYRFRYRTLEEAVAETLG
jgi:uncharacterized protein (TIGR01777 family)